MKITIPDWKYLIIPSAAYAIGFLSNAIVMAANHGQMPVLIPVGGESSYLSADDVLHCAMTAHTHLKFMADWIIIKSVGIASPGDFAEWFCELTYIPALVVWATRQIDAHQKL